MSKRLLLLAGLALTTGDALAESAPPTVLLQNELKYAAVPTFEGLSVALALGTPTQPGALYAYSVKYAAGAKSPPHTHPDARLINVISGRFYSGAGAQFDEKTLRALGPGDSILVPAETVHYGWAKDGDVLLLETGVGPTGLSLWPKPPPR
ncbi:cupin domain-containing protein [Methylosinus sp. PW1]|uniref:cupin domain-containing protein n=1 Tax=Methylosinus sp. PW1 TaxID=107636 RepID=UPI0005669A7E|nr:cupin domain-containing protein [Methylosinus sp. PW1]